LRGTFNKAVIKGQNIFQAFCGGCNTILDQEVSIIKSRRKTLQIEIKDDCTVVVRAPYWVSRAQIDDFIARQREWLQKNLARIRSKAEALPIQDKLTEHQLDKLTCEAKERIPAKVAEYAKIIGVTYKRVTIRSQKTRWGSCSSNGNLNFNCLLMLLPDAVADYVIIHELCHLIEPNHSDAFWRTVEKYCPDYKMLKQYLREHGDILMMRL